MIDTLPQTALVDAVLKSQRPKALDSISAKALSFEEKARKTANEFEAVMLNTLTKTMLSGIKSDGPFGGGQSEEMYRSLQAEEMAKALSNAGGIGLADIIYREIIQLQEAQQK